MSGHNKYNKHININKETENEGKDANWIVTFEQRTE